jgi:3-oxoacyl-[acyl-carrier protein] reductase/bacilysin biosynthesis oxidoreductase BacG
MKLKLEGKKAIITGGSSGIGLACAKALYEENVDIVIAADRDLEQAVNEIRKINNSNNNSKIITSKVDLYKSESFKSVVDRSLEKYGRIDILVNCAGAARAGAFSELEDQDFLNAWTLKTLGYIRMIKAVLPTMMSQGDGRIINIVGAAAKTPPPTFLAGSTANAALVNFTKGLSKDLAPKGIRINAISPAATRTERAETLAKQTAEAMGISYEEAIADSSKSIPTGRMIEPSEIAALVIFLVSDISKSITGTEILIDGGQTPGI